MHNDTFRWPGMLGVVSILLMVVAALLFMRLPAEAAGSKCARVQSVSGFETLINNCNACMNIQVIRDRAGVASATMRTFKMFKKGEFPLPFKGSGRTRIVSEESCGGSTAQERESDKSVAQHTKTCVIPVRTVKGMAMANTCGECRTFVIERMFENGERSNKSYALMGEQSLALKSEGATRAEIIHEAACKN